MSRLSIYSIISLLIFSCSNSEREQNIFVGNKNLTPNFVVYQVLDSTILVLNLIPRDSMYPGHRLFYLRQPIVKSDDKIFVIENKKEKLLFDFNLSNDDSICSSLCYKKSIYDSTCYEHNFVLKLDTSFVANMDTIYKFVLTNISILAPNDDLVFFISQTAGCKGIYLGFEELPVKEYFVAYGEFFPEIFDYNEITTWM